MATPATPPTNGPYLQMAIICEKVLQEQDGTISAIRVVDRVNVNTNMPGAPEQMPPVTFTGYAVISFKSGAARGRYTVTLRQEAPSGLRAGEQQLPVLFEGDDRGVNLILVLNLVLNQEGLYWFEVLLDGQQVTRMPLRTVYNRIGLSTS